MHLLHSTAAVRGVRLPDHVVGLIQRSKWRLGNAAGGDLG